MSTYQLRPRSTLVFGDGRPAGPGSGDMFSLPFPYPSTIAGFARTTLGRNEHGVFTLEGEQAEHLREQEVRGPLPALLDGGRAEALYFAPLDAVNAGSDDRPELLRLAPAVRQEGELDGLDDERDDGHPQGLLPLLPGRALRAKPARLVPLWRQAHMMQWLLDPQGMPPNLTARDLGLPLPEPAPRTGLAMSADSLTGTDGMLFTVQHREWRVRELAEGERPGQKVHQLGMLLEGPPGLREGAYPLGGERRLVDLRACDGGWPEPPEAIIQAIVASRRARLLLATPAVFERGSLPSWLLAAKEVEVQLRAAIVPRPQVVSGWDFAARRPKPTRRLVPAGAVYFVSLGGQDDAIERWARELWLSSISDDPQDRLDGFGLALLGADPEVSP